MADNVKKIFKNEISGTPKSELVLNNKIRGVFGKINVMQYLPDGLSENETRYDPYRYIYTFGRASYSNDLGLGPGGTTNIGIQAGWTQQLIFDYNVQVAFAYNSPIVVKPQDVSAILKYKRTRITGTTTIGNLQTVYSFANANRVNKDVYINLNTDFNFPSFSTTTGITISEERQNIIDDIVITPYSILFNLKYSATFNGSADINYVVFLSNIISNVSYLTFYQPIGIEITINGDKWNLAEATYQIGEQTNAYDMGGNTLTTSRSTKDGIVLNQYLANKIINEWHDGKQTISLTKVVNGISELNEVGDNAIILNAREADLFDTNRQSIARNRDGTAKIFKVDGTDFNYNGSYKQTLDVSEHKNGGK